MCRGVDIIIDAHSIFHTCATYINKIMALGYDYVKYRSETTCNPNTPAWLYKLRSSSFKSAPRALLLFQLLVLLISARQFAGAGTAEPTNVVSIMLQLFLLPYVLSLTFAPDPEGPGWRLSGIALLSSLLFIGLVSGGPQSLLFLYVRRCASLLYVEYRSTSSSSASACTLWCLRREPEQKCSSRCTWPTLRSARAWLSESSQRSC